MASALSGCREPFSGAPERRLILPGEVDGSRQSRFREAELFREAEKICLSSLFPNSSGSAASPAGLSSVAALAMAGLVRSAGALVPSARGDI
jgi:hypothetical protein